VVTLESAEPNSRGRPMESRNNKLLLRFIVLGGHTGHKTKG
jgi:hypothetical protein